MNEFEEVCTQALVYSTSHEETKKIIQNFVETRKAFGYDEPIKVWFTDNCCDEKFISELIPDLNDISPPPLLPLNDTQIIVIEVAGNSLTDDLGYMAFLGDYSSGEDIGTRYVGFDCEWEIHSKKISLMQIAFKKGMDICF